MFHFSVTNKLVTAELQLFRLLLLLLLLLLFLFSE